MTVLSQKTVSAWFDTDHKIKLIRYFWDQACVLKQIKLITDKQKWPVTAEQQADMIESPDIVRLIGLDGQPNIRVLAVEIPQDLIGQRRNQPFTRRNDDAAGPEIVQ